MLRFLSIAFVMLFSERNREELTEMTTKRNNKRVTAPGFHRDLWVMFWLGTALLVWNARFFAWSEVGQRLAEGLLLAWLVLGGCGVKVFCAVTVDPARRRSRRRRTCAAAKSAVY